VTSAEVAPGAEYRRVREHSVALCEPLETEDYGLQAMAAASPPKWHLAHTTWFFETFVLMPFVPGYRAWHLHYEHLFNSYYNGVGTPYARPRRGLLTRPTVAEIYRYRAAIDEQVLALLQRQGTVDPTLLQRIELGLHHEQQHQELLLTDLKYGFSFNPLSPAYRIRPADEELTRAAGPATWQAYEGGVVRMGAAGGGFCFDNETPTHRQFLEPFALATVPVTCGEYCEFIADGGYDRAELWLSDGWDTVQREGWQAPLYWREAGGCWRQFTLAGERPLVSAEPVCHLSFYEADAFARWSGARIPTEAEWEHAAGHRAVAGNFVDSGRLHPEPLGPGRNGVECLFGDVWEWTASGYLPYPGFRAADGAIGEYNGKFMSGQMVLRGGSCVSDAHHIRATYRNFFYPADRWQFSGLRLARSK